MQRLDEQLSKEISEIDSLIASRNRSSELQFNTLSPRSAHPGTDSLALMDQIQFSSSPDDLFCRLPTQLLPIGSASLANTSKDMVIATSLIKKGPATNLLQSFLSRFPFISLSSSFDPTVVRHLVTLAPTKVAKRTIKFLRAILNGSWIVSTEWMEECLFQGRLVEETPYEIRGDEYHPDEAAPRRARLSKLGNESSLLSGYSFYLYGAFSAPSIDDLRLLVADSGAHLVTNVKELTKKRPGKVYILCDPKEQADFEKDAGIIAKFRPLLASSWLLDCISTFQIVDPSLHIVL